MTTFIPPEYFWTQLWGKAILSSRSNAMSS
jgi:hypothetical protein